MIVAWTQQWFVVTLVADELGGARVDIGGDVAAGGLAALGLAGIALVGALSIAGRVFRIVLGALQVLIGATVVLSAVSALSSPVRSSASAITTATGVSGQESIESLIESITPTAWPMVAAVLGVAMIAVGVLILVTGSRWPWSARRYRTAGFADAEPDAPRSPRGDSVNDWDALSDGSDPTSG